MTQLLRTVQILLIVLLFCHRTEAQFLQASSEKASLVQGRILLVESEDFACFASLESSFNDVWKSNKEIQFKSAEEITLMLTPADAKKYVVLTGDKRQEVRSLKGKYEYADVFTVALYLGENAGRRNDLPVERHFVAKMSIPFCLSSTSELKIVANCLHEQIKIMASKPPNSGKLKKTCRTYRKNKKHG